jgi:N-acyl-D-amino-acid deacylase
VIAGGKIVSLARRASDRGTIEIDARGMAVAPGFIDIHSHGDGTLWADPRAESLVRQGVTTIVVGQDGSSRAPRSTDSTRDDESATQFATFAQLWSALERLQPAVNVASMV